MVEHQLENRLPPVTHHSLPPRRPAGAALIIALAFLVLITAVVLAFLTSARADRQNASTFSGSQETLRLADTSVSVVMSQIRDATTMADSAWASQPGMIRSYGTDGSLARAFKLYSSDDMVPSAFGSAEMANETAAMSQWQEQPAHFVDLNAPAIVPRPDPTDPASTTDATVFPIVDPRAAANAADGRPTVEGFSYNASIPGVVPATGAASDAQRLPMPVKWLYVLRDGSLIAPSAAGASTPTAAFIGTVPSQANPITGRIAFWTDDDTSKVNINTASEGSFWDVPRLNVRSEGLMAWRIPVRGEFQAVSGHPATTALSPVLGGLIGRPASPLPVFGITTSDYTNYHAPYYALTPRVSDQTSVLTNSAGSFGNTSRAGSADTTARAMTDGDFGTPRGQPVIYDTHRLYATTDELLFKPDRGFNLLAPDPTDPSKNESSREKQLATQLSRRDFFLTANSRSPETNLFGMPRVVLWPMQKLPGHIAQDPRDQLISFCGKIGAKNYYFERDSIAAGPPPTGNQSASSANSLTADYVNIPRNKDLYGYLGRMLDNNIPGFGAKFSSKWSTAGDNQITTMAYDYLRSGANLYQARDVTSGFKGGRKNSGSWGYEVPIPLGTDQGGYIMPIKIGTTQGMGRMVYVTEAAIVYIATAADPVTHKTTKMQSFMIFNLYRPNPTSGAASPALRLKVSAPTFGINGTIRHATRNGGASGTGRNYSFVGAHGMFYQAKGGYGPRTAGQSDMETQFPFVSAEIDVSASDTFSFPGGVVTLESLEIQGNSPQTIQTLTLDFGSSATLPLPQAVNSLGNFDSAVAQKFDDRLASSPQLTIIKGGDIVRSVRFSGKPTAPHKGDLRLLAFESAPPATWFEPHPSNAGTVVAYALDTSGNSSNTKDARANRFAETLRNDSWAIGFSPYNWSFQYGLTDGINAANPQTNVPRIDLGVHAAALVAGFDATKSNVQKVRPGGLLANLTMGDPWNSAATAVVPQGLTEALNQTGAGGDFSSGYGPTPDGASIVIPDFGSLRMPGGAFYDGGTNYRDDASQAAEPNRQIPSPVILGTLPSISSNGKPAPWQTLLFCANPLAGSTHPGFGISNSGVGSAAKAPFTALPDHLFLDLWWMPAVDPYAVSEPLSTAGKVNLNYQIAPFTYINRGTGIYALMKSVKLAGVLDTDSTRYKKNADDITNTGHFYVGTSRFNLNLSTSDGSLKAFEDRFAAGDIFRSASEVCTIPLVPTGETTSTLPAWWNARRLTGDNLREAPYNALYSRVTTKSNTYTVHYRVQALKQVPTAGSNWEEWVEGKDQIVGEYRGATTIERFLDPAEPGIPDYATATNPAPIDKFYRFRVLSVRQFAP